MAPRDTLCYPAVAFPPLQSPTMAFSLQLTAEQRQLQEWAHGFAAMSSGPLLLSGTSVRRPAAGIQEAAEDRSVRPRFPGQRLRRPGGPVTLHRERGVVLVTVASRRR